jgi:hypothetical protein
LPSVAVVEWSFACAGLGMAVDSSSLLIGSFALLYSQILLPTPAGVGVVDLGLLAGAAGGVGDSGFGILAWWRFYTTIVGGLIGAWFAWRDFGWAALRAGFKGKGKEARSQKV